MPAPTGHRADWIPTFAARCGQLPAMEVIALISGGKDSTFNMMECVRHGHTIVALVNLCPEAAEVEVAVGETVILLALPHRLY